MKQISFDDIVFVVIAWLLSCPFIVIQLRLKRKLTSDESESKDALKCLERGWSVLGLEGLC